MVSRWWWTAVLDERKRKRDRVGGGVPVEVAMAVAVAVVPVLEGLVGGFDRTVCADCALHSPSGDGTDIKA